MQLSSDLWQEERKLLLIWNDRTKSCSWCPCRSFMCTYLDLSKGAEETECQVRGKVLSPAQFWGLPWGFSRGVHKHWLSTGRPEATEISLKVYRADEGWLGEWIWEMDLQWWVGGFGERAQGRVKESKCLQDNVPSPQFCPVLHRWLCRQHRGLQSTSIRFLWVSAMEGTLEWLALSVYTVPVVVQAGKWYWWYQMELVQKCHCWVNCYWLY